MLLESPADANPLLSDYRGLFHGRALAVALPRTVDEVSRLLAWSSAERIGVVPQGGNTGYCGGATPDGSGAVVVALARLVRIRALDPRQLPHGRGRLHPGRVQAAPRPPSASSR